MKATELKIGDIVSFLGNLTKVHSIDPPAIYVIDEGNIVWGTNEINNDITPIPLTEEILEKSGWRKSGYMSVEGRETLYRLGSAMDKDRIVICFQAQGVFLEMWQGHSIVRKEIKYVHQLQHLLWALGIDDDLKKSQ